MREKKNHILNDNSFIVIESAVLLNENLKHSDKLLYGYIVAFSRITGYCYLSTKRLCELMGLKERQIRYCLSRLKKFNYITIDVIKNKRLITPSINKFISDREKKNKIDLYDYDWLNEE